MNTNKTQQLLPQAFSLHQSGKIDEAEAIYRTILEEDSANPQVLSMLGMLQLQRGNWEEGIRLLEATLDVDPEQPDTLNNLGYALHAVGRHEDALERFDRAIELYPDHVSAYYNRGNTLQTLQRLPQAIESYRKALALRPNHADTLVRLGNAHAEAGQHDDALTHYIKALNIRPEDAGISSNLGLALKALGRHKEAQNYFRKAVTLKPDFADAHYNLALALQEQGHNDEALAACEQTLAFQPTHCDALALRGQLLQQLGRDTEAQASYQAVLELEPQNIVALTHLGILHMEMGRNAEATHCFEQALEIDPGCAEASHNLATLGYYANDEAFAKLQSAYADRAVLPDDSRVYLNFAMGRTLEKMGRHDEAFEAYQEGNRLHYEKHPFDENAEEKLLAESTAFFTPELLESCRSIARSVHAQDDRTPVFIVGMPRSGTTLIEQILSSHPEVFGAGELDTFDVVTAGVQLPIAGAPEWEAALAQLGQRAQNYLDRVWQLAPEARFITDKMPGNYMHLGLLHLMLPNAKIIHAMRDPLDCCLSCYTMRFNEQHGYAYDLETLGRQFRRYQALMQYWHETLPAGSILDVRYEELVASPETEVRRMLDYLGLPWNDACLHFHENKRAVRTASLNQVRQPVYASSVARWKNFESQLAPLMAALDKSGQ